MLNLAQQSKLQILAGFLSLILLITLTIVFYQPVLAGLGRWLEVTAPSGTADLVVALGGDRGRQDEAVRLLRRGVAQRILFVGSDIRPRDYHCLDVEPKHVIAPQRPAYTTMEEAEIVRHIAETRHLSSIVIVTSPYHMRRARLAFERVFRESDIVLKFAPSPNPAFTLDSWWRTHVGRKLVLTEYLGLFYYWLTV